MTNSKHAVKVQYIKRHENVHNLITSRLQPRLRNVTSHILSPVETILCPSDKRVSSGMGSVRLSCTILRRWFRSFGGLKGYTYSKQKPGPEKTFRPLSPFQHYDFIGVMFHLPGHVRDCGHGQIYKFVLYSNRQPSDKFTLVPLSLTVFRPVTACKYDWNWSGAQYSQLHGVALL